ncbi:MAG: 6-bladed beta-propeller [bacterium]|nr:6-bladed beta-propeller [bacterium]
MKKQIFIINALSFLFIINCSGNDTYTEEIVDGVKHIHNLSPKWGDEIKLGLEFVQQIGSLETEDENYQLFRPLSAAIDDEGNIFIMDMGAGHIKKYTPDGKYLMTIGEKGQGPGEFDYPMFININGNELICADGDGRIHKFDTDGKFTKTFRPEFQSFRFLILKNGKLVLNASGSDMFQDVNPLLLNLVDFDGNNYGKFCEPVIYKENAGKSFTANFIQLSSDSKSNVIVSFSRQNRIEKFTPEGNLIFKSDRSLNYDLTYELQEREYERRGQMVKRPFHVFTSTSRDIGVDSSDRIWVLGYKKQYEEDDRMCDFLEYEVYDNEGVLLTKVPLPDHRFDNIVQCGDILLLMDPYETCSVFEYKIVEK